MSTNDRFVRSGCIRTSAGWLVACGLTGCLGGEIRPPDDEGDAAEAAEEQGEAAEEQGEEDDGTPAPDMGAETGGSDSGGGEHEGVRCDETVCYSPEICCAAMVGSSCAESCSQGTIPQHCDGPEDCDGGVCCWGLTGGGLCADDISQCEGYTPEVACQTEADCAEKGGACEPHMYVYWVNICQA